MSSEHRCWSVWKGGTRVTRWPARWWRRSKRWAGRWSLAPPLRVRLRSTEAVSPRRGPCSGPELFLHPGQELLGEAGDRVDVIHRLEAVLPLAVGDQAGRLCHRHPDPPELLEGRGVDVEQPAFRGRLLLR